MLGSTDSSAVRSGRAPSITAVVADMAAAARADPDARLLWSPVLFAIGIGLYFAMPIEPSWGLGAGVLALAGLLGLVARPAPAAHLPAKLLLVVGLGLTAAGLRSGSTAAPVLQSERGVYAVAATVARIDRLEDGDLRLILSDLTLDGVRDGVPARARLTVRTAVPELHPGDRIAVRAQLYPPPEPVAPAAFDFARQNWFRSIGAVGFALGPLDVLEAAGPHSLETAISDLRDQVAMRVRTRVAGETGGLAAALLTGLRGGLSAEVVEAMRTAGLAHLLAISGLHMGLVTASLFFAVRALLALAPAVALTYSTKKLAAVVAWLGAAGYLALSGASVPTVRAFAMTSLVLLAVCLDRKAISLRLVALAALAILAVTPEALLSASFQMSFAAVVALVAIYQRLAGPMARRFGRRAGWPARLAAYVLGVAATTVIAEVAIGPFAAYHFHKVPSYGLLANLVAMPVMAFWVMPWGLVALVLMPLGAEAVGLVPMAWGLDVVIATAKGVTALPHAVNPVPVMPLASLVLIAVGGLWLALWSAPRLRLPGLLPIVAGLMLAPFGDRPDILVDRDGKLFAIRGEDGRLYLSNLRAGRFARSRWLERNGQTTTPRWQDLAAQRSAAPPSLRCDGLGCLYTLSRGGRRIVVAFPTDLSAMAEDCRHADLVVTGLAAPFDCTARLGILDRWDLWRRGAHTISFTDAGTLRIDTVADAQGDRPWSLGRRTRPPWETAAD